MLKMGSGISTSHACTCKLSSKPRLKSSTNRQEKSNAVLLSRKCSSDMSKSVSESESVLSPGPGNSKSKGTGSRLRSISVGDSVLSSFSSTSSITNGGENLSLLSTKRASASFEMKAKFLLAPVSSPTTSTAVISRKKKKSCDKKDISQQSHNSLYLEPGDLQNMLENLSLKSERNEGLELPQNVLYYGWFFSPEVSTVIKLVVMELFGTCIRQVNQFERFILTCCKDADIKVADVLEYYKKPGKKIKSEEDLKYHITARFLGRDPNNPYQTLAHDFLDKTFRIHLVGLVFTPRTLGVRVKLTSSQQLLFDEKDEKPGESSGEKTAANIRKQIQDELKSYKNEDKLHKKINSNCKMKIDKNGIAYKSIMKADSSTSSNAVTTSRAHITIGCAPKVVAKQTGDDLVDIIDLEQRPASKNSNFQQDFKIKHGILRQFGRQADAFVFYPDFEMIVPGTFNYFI